MTTAAAYEPIEADVMREYDEHIRLYTPMLQRIIILVAVIVAVPVVLWTITAFVRAYVAPPQIQTFRPLAASQAPAQTNSQANSQAGTQSNVQVAAQTANVATDARTPLIQIKKPADAPQAASQMQQAAAPMPPAPANAAADAVPAAGSALATRTGVPPPPFAATRAAPSTVAAPAITAPALAAPTTAAPAPANVALANNAAGQATPAAANAMPMPATSSADNQPGSTALSQDQSAANDNADDLPAGTPLRGRIPLPTRRPHVAGLTTVAVNDVAANDVAQHSAGVAAAMPSRIPLPRARPAAAPEAGPVETSYPIYDPSQIH
jgi:hypothetical protein